MFCMKCGNQLKENDKFCGGCGQPAGTSADRLGGEDFALSRLSFAEDTPAPAAHPTGAGRPEQSGQGAPYPYPAGAFAPSAMPSAGGQPVGPGSRLQAIFQEKKALGVVATAVAAVVMILWIALSIGSERFEPVGVWQVKAPEALAGRMNVELDEQGGVWLRIKELGIFHHTGLQWSKDGNSLQLSGSFIPYNENDAGTVGSVMTYDVQNKVLRWQVGAHELYLKKE